MEDGRWNRELDTFCTPRTRGYALTERIFSSIGRKPEAGVGVAHGTRSLAWPSGGGGRQPG